MRKVLLAVTMMGLGVVLACGLANKDNGSDAVNGSDSNGTKSQGFDYLYSSYLNKCSSCHAPSAMGRTPDTEKTLDFSSADTAFASLNGNAAGLQGNVQDCNGVPFIGSSYDTSLLAAVLDENVRANFKAGQCDADVVTDMVNKVGSAPPEGFLDALKTWINNGAPKN